MIVMIHRYRYSRFAIYIRTEIAMTSVRHSSADTRATERTLDYPNQATSSYLRSNPLLLARCALARRHEIPFDEPLAYWCASQQHQHARAGGLDHGACVSAQHHHLRRCDVAI